MQLHDSRTPYPVPRTPYPVPRFAPCRSGPGQRLFVITKNYLTVSVACFLLLGYSKAFADERRESDSPFRIEDFAPKKGRYTLNAGVGYAVADSKNVSVSIVAIPLSYGYSLLLPDVTLDNRRRDSVFTWLGMRYALGDGLNVNVGFKADAGRSVVRDNSTARTEYDSGWRSVTAGVDYQISSPFDHPFVLAFAEIALAENNGGGALHGKAATVGLSSHWAFDPVILSLTGTYSYLGMRQDEGKNHDPGDVLGFAASFGIAINPEITLRAGLAQSFSTGDRTGNASSEWGSNTSFTLGYTQRLSSALVMNIGAQAGVAGSDTARILADFTWRP